MKNDDHLNRRSAGNSIYASTSLVLTVAVLLLIVFPLGRMFFDALFPAAGEQHPVAAVLQDPQLLRTLWHTAVVVVVAGSSAVIIGFGFAWLNERTDASLGWFGSVTPLVPLILPPVALCVGWVFLAHEQVGLLNAVLRAGLRAVGVELDRGPLNIIGWPGLIFVYIIFLVPFVYIAMQNGLRMMDQSLEEASRTSGGGIGRTLRSVTFPALKPALLSATLLVVMFSLAVYSIPATLGLSSGVHVLSVEVVSLTRSFPSRIEEATVLGLLTLVVVGVLWGIQRRLVARAQHATTGTRRSALIPLGRWRPVARLSMIAYLAISSVLPLLALLLVSLQSFWSPNIDWSTLGFDNYRTVLTSGTETQRALVNSVVLAVIGASITTLVAFLLITYSRMNRAGSTTSRLVESITKIPAGIPHVVLGVAFILAFAGPPFGLYGTHVILLLAFITIYMPQASIVVGTSYDHVGFQMVEASRCSGASPWATVRHILAPLMSSGLVAGWALLFILIAGELNAAVLLASQETPVVGFTFLRIWEQGTFPQLAALACLLALISTTIVTVAMSRAHRRVTGSGMGG